jgi:hypothetical protein
VKDLYNENWNTEETVEDLRINNPTNERANKLSRHSQKKYTNKCLTSLATREMQVQTAERFHLTPVRMASIQKTENKCW